MSRYKYFINSITVIEDSSGIVCVIYDSLVWHTQTKGSNTFLWNICIVKGVSLFLLWWCIYEVWYWDILFNITLNSFGQKLSMTIYAYNKFARLFPFILSVPSISRPTRVNSSWDIILLTVWIKLTIKIGLPLFS